MASRIVAATALSSGLISGPAAPDYLAAAHPLLARDVAALAPWTRCEVPGLSGPCWQAAPVLAGPAVLVCGECSSSLDMAWGLVQAGLLPEWGSVLALSQNKGRGQLRRPWLSPPGNIHAAMRLPVSVRHPDLRPMFAAWSVAVLLEALLDTGAGEVRIKWPNDLLVHGDKVGGILLEERGDAVVAGVGLNLTPLPPELEADRDLWAPRAGVLQPGEAMGPLVLWTRMTQELPAVYTMAATGLETGEIIRQVESRLAWRGRRVKIRGMDGSVAGFDRGGLVIVGIAEDGALRVAGAEGETLVRTGSVYLASNQAPDRPPD
jgi:BirA family transcriptional regulator, biotin operon repressor / biotin---[acetyl-CoA-carboxylase] ligase